MPFVGFSEAPRTLAYSIEQFNRHYAAEAQDPARDPAFSMYRECWVGAGTGFGFGLAVSYISPYTALLSGLVAPFASDVLLMAGDPADPHQPPTYVSPVSATSYLLGYTAGCTVGLLVQGFRRMSALIDDGSFGIPRRAPEWKDLKPYDASAGIVANGLSDRHCLITQDTVPTTDHGIVLVSVTGTHTFYDYAQFKAWWTANGTDPTPGAGVARIADLKNCAFKV